MEIIFGIIALGFFVLYIYAFVLLWKDNKFEDVFKLVATVAFFLLAPTAYLYLLYRFFRSK